TRHDDRRRHEQRRHRSGANHRRGTHTLARDRRVRGPHAVELDPPAVQCGRGRQRLGELGRDAQGRAQQEGRSQVKSRKKSVKKPTAPKPVTKPVMDGVGASTVERLLTAIRDLQVENPYRLIAVIDWIRNEWKGTDALQEPHAVAHAVKLIDERAKKVVA